MAPQATFQILNNACMSNLYLTENYLVVSVAPKTTASGEFNILDVGCQHKGMEICEHRRRLPVGSAWYFDCCGDMMAVGNEDWGIRVWNLTTGKKCLTFTGHTDEIMGVLYPTPNTIISGACDGALIVWDVPSGTRRYTLSNGDSKPVPLKAHDSMLVSATHDGVARIWDLQTGQCTHVLQGHKERVSRAEFNADGSLLATGAHPGEMNIWNTKTGACLATCHGHTKVPTQFSTHPGSPGLLVSASADGSIRTWEWATGALVRTLFAGDAAVTNNALRGFAWVQDYMVTGSMNGLLCAWDRYTDQFSFELRERNSAVFQFASRGNLVAVNVRGSEEGEWLIELYDMSALDRIQTRSTNVDEDLGGVSLVMI